jgi:hypothetical protein
LITPHPAGHPRGAAKSPILLNLKKLSILIKLSSIISARNTVDKYMSSLFFYSIVHSKGDCSIPPTSLCGFPYVSREKQVEMVPSELFLTDLGDV